MSPGHGAASCLWSGWDDLASPLLTCAHWAAQSIGLSLLARWGAPLQAVWCLTPHWLCSWLEGTQHHVVPTHLVGWMHLGVALDFHSSTLDCPQPPKLLSWLGKVSSTELGTLLKAWETWGSIGQEGEHGSVTSQGTLEKYAWLLRGDRPHCSVPSCSHIPVPNGSLQLVPA